MRTLFGPTLIGLIFVASSSPSYACFGHRNRCHGQHRVQTTAAYAHVIMTPSATMVYSSPQATAVADPILAAPVTATATPVVSTGVQPSYDYTAGATGQPAYYYTYDSSGKLIIAQWMDWVFRGGRAAGEPAPPLPIIGALRGR